MSLFRKKPFNVLGCDACHKEETVDKTGGRWATVFHPNGRRSDYCDECHALALPPPVVEWSPPNKPSGSPTQVKEAMAA